MSTAKPMLACCVQHYSTHFIKKIGKSLEPFFHKVQKTAKKGKKWPPIGPKMTSLAYFLTFVRFWSIFVHFEQKKNPNLKLFVF